MKRFAPAAVALATSLAPAACDAAVSGPPGPTCTAARLVGPNHALVLIPVKVDGKGPFPFVLDTGSTATVIGLPLAKRLGLPSIGTRAYGAGGRFSAAASVAPSVQVAATTRYAVAVGIADIAQIGSVAGVRIDGLLGYTFLAPYELTVDYPRRRVCLRR